MTVDKIMPVSPALRDAPRRTIEEALDSMTLTFFERYPSVSAFYRSAAGSRVCVSFANDADIWAPTFGEAIQEWYRRKERRDRKRDRGEREFDSWVMLWRAPAGDRQRADALWNVQNADAGR